MSVQPVRHSVPVPQHMAGRPRDERGYIVPWFVAWHDDKPLFPVMDRTKWNRAVRASRCWICGSALGANKTFVVGPMCSINRISAEPPSHLSCAEYAARVCPFLVTPRMGRLPLDKTGLTPDDVEPPPGLMVKSNPGLAALWTTRSFRLRNTGDRRDDALLVMGTPTRVDWWSEGERAEPLTVRVGWEAGVQRLREVAAKDGPAAVADAERIIADARRMLGLE
jgi:hypothetical protein